MHMLLVGVQEIFFVLLDHAHDLLVVIDKHVCHPTEVRFDHRSVVSNRGENRVARIRDAETLVLDFAAELVEVCGRLLKVTYNR